MAILAENAEVPIARQSSTLWGVDDTMPALFFEDLPAKYSRPERALGVQVGSVEHDNASHHFHIPKY